MGYDEARSAVHQCVHRLLDVHLRARVNGARRLVEYEHGRICENRAGYSQKLTLTLRDIFAVLLEHGLIPVGQSAYEVVNPCGLRRADDLLA